MIKKQIVAICITCFFIINTSAQIYITRNGRVTFFSKTPLENIDARNNEVTSILDTKKGEFVFIVLVKGFKFKKALMEEHFNENYLESNLFPKAIFKGTISDLNNINFSIDGLYPVTVKGNLTLHGVTKNIEVPGSISLAQGIINANSNFNINLKDYKIKVPAIVVNNIAESINITVDCKYVSFKKDKI